MRAQAHGRLVQQLVRHGPGFFRGAHLGRQHVRVADRFLVLGLGQLEVFAAQPVKEPLAPHRSPDFAGLLAVEREQIVHGVDAFFVQPLLSARADAGQIAQRELVERLGQNVERQRHQAVGLFHVAGDFGEIAVGGEADGAAQHFADAVADCCLDSKAEIHARSEAAARGP